jgi:hypothetical protein
LTFQNGKDSVIATEASNIYDFVKSRLEANRAELTHLEDAVADQLDTRPPQQKRKKTYKKNAAGSAGSGGALSDDGFLSGLPADINLEDLELSDDSDD